MASRVIVLNNLIMAFADDNAIFDDNRSKWATVSMADAFLASAIAILIYLFICSSPEIIIPKSFAFVF